MKVSILINSRDRIEVLYHCLQSALAQNYAPLEIIVFDDNSTQYQLKDMILAEFPETNTELHCFRSESSLGVAGGRNFLMQQASGDIYCIIDDDARFADNNCITNLVSTFNKQPGVGIIATKIVDYVGQETTFAVPFSQRWRKKQPALINTSQQVSYYVGTCHAINHRVIEQCGNYQPNLMFGEEELDLSYRAIEAGWKILYLPEVVVHHHPQSSVVGQVGKKCKTELYYHIRNRFILAYKYLPWLYIPVYLGIWLSRYAIDAVKQVAFNQLFSGIVAGVKELKNLQRTPMQPKTVQYIKNHFGRLWY